MPSASANDLAEADELAQGLLLLYEQLGVTALVISLREDALIVRCQCADDVPALVQRVAKEYDRPEVGRLN